MMTGQEFYEELWLQRGIAPDSVCPRCNGLGQVLYPTTGTWRKGVIAGQAFTPGVCDCCWGSGNKDRPWVDLREQRKRIDMAWHFIDKNWTDSVKNAMVHVMDIIEGRRVE